MKYSLVTGGSRGLGRAICLKLSQMGIPVLINYQANRKAAEEVKDQIIAGGGHAELLGFNVADEAEVSKALDEWQQVHPDDYIGYLVNNAGIRKDNLMFMMPSEDWHSVIDVSLQGFFYVTRHLLPRMMMRGHSGRIVNMTSLSGIKGMAGQTNYSAAKAALIGATKALAQEAASRNVTVNAVAPGFIETDMTKAINEAARNEWLKGIPMHRAGTVTDVADVVVFLASDLSSYVTAQVIGVDGGMGA